MNKVTAIRAFASLVLNEKVVIPRHRSEYDNQWGMVMNASMPRLVIPPVFTAKTDKNDRLFRNNFVDRCPCARGFSNATLSILHECGHWATKEVFDIHDYQMQLYLCRSQEDYMKITYEYMATDWAIDWLENKDNRKLAKRFEKDFFGY